MSSAVDTPVEAEAANVAAESTPNNSGTAADTATTNQDVPAKATAVTPETATTNGSATVETATINGEVPAEIRPLSSRKRKAPATFEQSSKKLKVAASSQDPKKEPKKAAKPRERKVAAPKTPKEPNASKSPKSPKQPNEPKEPKASKAPAARKPRKAKAPEPTPPSRPPAPPRPVLSPLLAAKVNQVRSHLDARGDVDSESTLKDGVIITVPSWELIGAIARMRWHYQIGDSDIASIRDIEEAVIEESPEKCLGCSFCPHVTIDLKKTTAFEDHIKLKIGACGIEDQHLLHAELEMMRFESAKYIDWLRVEGYPVKEIKNSGGFRDATGAVVEYEVADLDAKAVEVDIERPAIAQSGDTRGAAREDAILDGHDQAVRAYGAVNLTSYEYQPEAMMFEVSATMGSHGDEHWFNTVLEQQSDTIEPASDVAHMQMGLETLVGDMESVDNGNQYEYVPTHDAGIIDSAKDEYQYEYVPVHNGGATEAVDDENQFEEMAPSHDGGATEAIVDGDQLEEMVPMHDGSVVGSTSDMSQPASLPVKEGE